ncbi:cfem domain-containing protein, partial [Colletotrichum incanum]
LSYNCPKSLDYSSYSISQSFNMKYTVAIVAFAGFSAAQTLDVPQCAQQCLANAITANGQCTIGDAACLCNPANFQAIVTAGTPCVLQNCGADAAVNQVIPAAGRICAAVAGGAAVSSVVASASPVASGAVSSASAAASSAIRSASAAVSSRASSAASSAVSSAVRNISSIVTSAAGATTTRTAVVTSAVTTRNGTTTATTTQTPVTVNGAVVQGPIGIMAALAFGALAYL